MTEYTFPSIDRSQRTLIVGLGETGAAAARWLARAGAKLRVLDTREAPPGLADLQDALASADVEYAFGGQAFNEDVLAEVGSLVLSPGLSPRAEPVRTLIAQAYTAGVEVIGEIELFARALADMAEQGYRPAVLAVTGTNGKTTVTAMTRQLISACGISVRAAGNIGPAALSALQEALDDEQLPQAWVLELSSFQLESTHSLTPDAGVVLNVTQDHLDWHGSMQAYAGAKSRLLHASRIAIINRDDPLVADMVNDERQLSVRSFGRDAPRWEGDLGLEISNDISWLSVAEASDFALPASPARRKKNTPEPQRESGRLTRLMPADALRVKGSHNVMNALAGLALGRSLDLKWSSMLHALRDYAGEPNRTEFVRNIGGVDFVNDSKGTNVGATVAALEGLGQPLVLIAGGLGKGQDFSLLAESVKRHARAVVLIGKDAALLESALADTGIPTLHADSMDQAVHMAFEQAAAGDAVLLSPACASMDMFRNYAERGQAFVSAVDELALEKGEVA